MLNWKYPAPASDIDGQYSFSLQYQSTDSSILFTNGHHIGGLCTHRIPIMGQQNSRRSPRRKRSQHPPQQEKGMNCPFFVEQKRNFQVHFYAAHCCRLYYVCMRPHKISSIVRIDFELRILSRRAEL